MGRKAKPLAPLTIGKLSTPGMHFVGHVSGLALRVSPAGARSWILRLMVGGKRCDVGLGSYPEIPLVKAKDRAIEQRQLVQQGVDPVAARKSARMALQAERASFMSFRDAALQYIATHQAGWKNAKHASQWRNTLATYVYPIMGDLHVKDVTLHHVLQVIEPIWQGKAETASRVRNRIELVLDWAKARGLRKGDNPAAWKGNLQALLPERSKIAKVKHHASMEWGDTPAFLKKLRAQDSTGAKALEFIILTSCRSGEARLATWDEIDLERGVWTIPAGRMKAGKEHRIPLSKSALALLKKLPRMGSTPHLFSNREGKPLSDMALTQLLRRMEVDCTVHGFRSTFRDWAGETTAFPREVIEHALAHQLKDKSEAAYARGDLFTKRTRLMAEWATFLEADKSSHQVIPMNRKEMQHG